VDVDVDVDVDVVAGVDAVLEARVRADMEEKHITVATP
jgi:hypothetical protein